MSLQSSSFLQTLGVNLPIIQAPMAGIDTPELAIAVSEAGGLGSLACALSSPDDITSRYAIIRKHTTSPINLNFFCHRQSTDDPILQRKWKGRLQSYYEEFGITDANIKPSTTRAPFDEKFCDVVEDLKPSIVSFHFGLPVPPLLNRVKKAGVVVLSSATTVEEAIWLERNGADAIIAQGAEAGGHRALFLNDDIRNQPMLDDLLPSILKTVQIPVIAAGGITDAKMVNHVLDLGAVAAQIGTAYLFCPEAKVSPLYREALSGTGETTITNIYSGRPARGIVNRFIKEVGPLSADAPPFPFASTYVNPLRQASEKENSTDFMQMWSGTNRVPHHLSARELTLALSKI